MALTEKEKRALFGNYETAIDQRNAGYSPNHTTLTSGAESYNELIRQEEAARKAEYDNRISNAQKLNNLAARYTSLVDRLNNAASRYGADYGKQKSNYQSINRSRNEFSGVSDEIEDMLAEIDASDLDVATKNEFATALIELGKATDSASLDARSVTAAYNNPATQRIMQGYDEAAYSDTKWNAVKESPQMALYNAQLDALGGEDIGAKNAVAPYMWQLEESPVAQDRMLGELSRRAAGLANQYAPLTPEYQGFKDRALGYEETRSALSAEREAASDEALMAEIGRLQGISTETAISSVRQTIDELDAQAQSMKKYWDEQAYLNDNSGSAPDYEEYEELMAKIAKYENILNRLLVDKDNERMGSVGWTDDSIARSYLSENYNATNLYDRVNKAFFDTTVDFGVEYTPPKDVKASSYPIAQRPENYMTQDERDTFNKLWHYEGEAAATAYFERLTPILETRGAQQMMAEAKQFTEDYPNWAWVQARGANAMKPISSAFMIGDILGGEGVRENSAANMNTQVANFVDSYTPEVTNYTGNAKILGRDLDQFLYGTVGSTVDSAVRMMTASFIGGTGAASTLKEKAKGVARATGALMSLEVFPSVVLEEKEKGRSDSEAVVLGALRAAIEGLTEKYSVELLFSPSKNFGELLLKGAFAEGSEEIAATVLNGAVDIIAADKDNIIKEWERRTALGIDSVEALADIIYERGKSTLADGLSGALSGLLFSAGGGISGAFDTRTTKEAKSVAESTERSQTLVDNVLAANPTNKIALEAKHDLAEGKSVSAKTIQKLINASETESRKGDVETISQAVSRELTNRGEANNVAEVAEAVTKAVTGETLSDGELRAIQNSVFGTQIYEELSGTASAGAWVNQLRDNLDVIKIAQPQTETKRVQRVSAKSADATTKDGTNVRIVGLTDNANGAVKVRVEDGSGNVKEMAASELEMDEDMRYLVESASKFGGASAVVYAGYMPGTDVGTYLQQASNVAAFAKVAAGDQKSAGNILKMLKAGDMASQLADVQIDNIFEATLAEAKKTLSGAQGKKTSGKGNFTWNVETRSEESLRGREATAVRFMRNLAAIYPDIDIEIFESDVKNSKYQGEQGSYRDGKIRIDLNAGKYSVDDQIESAMLRTLSHELTHHLQKTAPKQYAELKAFVIDHLAEWNNGKELDDLITAKQSRARGELSRDAAIDEVVADSCEMMLKNSAAVKQLAVENKGLFSKILDFVKKFLSDLRRAFAGVEANDAAARYLKKFESEMQKLWDEAFAASVQNAKTATSEKRQKNTAQEGDVQYADRQFYNPLREKLAKLRLDALSDQLGDLFPLSANFENAIQSDKTPMSGITIAADSVAKKKGITFYKAAKEEFRSAYGAKTWFSIQQLGISAEATTRFAEESMAKVSDRKDMQAILDMTPNFKTLVEGSRLLSVELPIHNNNKKTALLVYRLYNSYVRQETILENGAMKTNLVPHIVVFSVNQNLADARAHMVTDIKDVAISSGHNSSRPKYAAHANGNISIATIADVYNIVKRIDRDSGGLNYTDSQKLKYLFGYTQKDDGTLYSERDTTRKEIPLNHRLSGDALLDAQDLIEEIKDKAEVSPNGYVTVYHRTTAANARKIMDSGKMSAKEDGVFFSTSKDGTNSTGYGDTIVEFKIPAEKFLLDDIFDNEAHLRIPLENRRQTLDVSEYVQNSDTEQKSDRDYSRAVKRDDMAAAARMVDEAANAALSESQARVNGKLVHLFHGSETFGFTEFDPSRSVENTLFFSDNIKVSAEYNNGKAVPQRIGKPFVAQKSYSAKDLNELADRYRGYKGIQIKELTVDAKAGDRSVHVVTHTGIDRYYSAAEFHKTVWDIDKAYERGSGIYEVVLDMKRPLIVDAKYNNWDSIPFEGRVRNTRQIAKSARLRGYDGVIFKNLHDVAGTNEVNPAYFSTVYAVFKPNQVFSADPVTYDNNGDVIPLSERFNPENNDIRHSERDYEAAEIARLEQRITALEQGKSDAFLAGQMRTARQAGKETRRLTEKIDTLKGKLEEAKQTAKDTKKATAEDRKAANLRARNLEAQIKKLTKEAEASGFLAGEMSVARQAGAEIRSREEQIRKLKAELADRKAAYSANLAKFREGRDTGTYRERVVKRIRNLQDMLITNSDKKHIPEMLKEPLGNFLLALDTSSATKLKGKGETKGDADMYRRAVQLQKALERARNNTDEGGYLDLSDEFMERIEQLSEIIHEITGGVDAVADAPINLMNSSQLNDLNFVLRTLQHSINSMNKMLANARFQTVAQAAESTISELDQVREYEMKNGVEWLRNATAWKNTTPVYAFDRMGEAGKELFKAMWAAQSDFAFHASELLKVRENIVSNKQVRKWSQDVQTIKLSNNRSVRMTTAQMMSFYCLANRQQALEHLQTGGMRIATISYGRKSIQQARAYNLTAEDITKVAGMVKGDAKRVADQMQKYMTERGSEWGNEISMARFGYRAFTEPVYFPIRTESSQIAKDTKSTQENSINRLLNMSFTKSVQPNAKTCVVVDNIFDVFSGHMSDMAKYNAFALPVLDMIKWYDYNVQDTLEDGTQKDHRAVKTSIESAYGKEALTYISTFLEDVNGADEGGRTRSAGWAQKLTSHYKAASVGANLRVAIQQPTSYWRAAAVLDPKYLAVGEKVMWHNTPKVKKEMEQYAGISIWKSLGFRDFNVGRSVREQIAGTLPAASMVYDDMMDASMMLASAGDTWTWCRLWEACKAEVKATQKLSGEALMQATADRFNDVIARTQVVDSVMTRSHTMRSKNLYDQLMTPFMAEPTLSYNVLTSTIFEYNTETRKSNKQTAWKKFGKKIGRAGLTFFATAAWTAVFQSLADAARDDDDYETFWQKFLDAMLPNGKPKASFKEDPLKWVEELLDQGNWLSNLNITNNIPGAHRTILNALKGFAGDAMWQEGIKNLLNAAGAASELVALEAGWTDKATDKTWNGNMTWWGAMQKGLQAFSQLTSLPIYNMVRDVTALYNTTVQEFFGRQDIKILTYDPGTEGRIANAYADGFLTFEEAMAEMEKFGIAADTAYEKLVKAAGASSKYDALKEAITSGGDVKAVMEELAGYGIKEDLIEKQVKSTIKDLVLGTEEAAPTMDKQTAKNLLVEYLGLSYPEAHYAVEAYGEENFSKYDDIRDAILNGGDVQEAMDELVEYGTSEKTVREEISTSIRIWYQGETKDDGTVVAPIINREQATEMLVQHCGKKQEDAEKLVTEWTLALDTGMKSDDVKESFLNDEISTDEAIDLRMTYFGQTEEEAAQTVAEWMFEDEFGFSYDDRNIRFRDGEISAAEMVEIEMDYGGRTKEEAQKNLVGKVMDGYKDGSFSESEAMSMLTTNGGLTSDEATKKIRYADAVAAYPDADIDDAWVDEYYAEVESSGISFNTFIDYRTSVKGIKGEGKKENRMAVIDSLPLSPAQKDALYYAEGWAESTIGEAPWH